MHSSFSKNFLCNFYFLFIVLLNVYITSFRIKTESSSFVQFFSIVLFLCTGNGLIDESEFLQWVGRIQAIRDEQDDSTSKQDENDDVTEDLIAAFRYVNMRIVSIFRINES